MSIVANAGASLRWLNRDPIPVENVRAGLTEIISEGQRAGEVIRSLQSLTRRQAPVLERVDLHVLIHHIMTLSRSELERRRITVEYGLQAGNSLVYGDSADPAGAAEPVMNAIEAMSDVDSRPRILTLHAKPETVSCQIADTGSGMDADVQARLFESFYHQTAGNGDGVNHQPCDH